jgi:NAD+ synthetase
MRVAIGQVDTTIGDFKGNLAKIREVVARAREGGADLVLLPELAISGYPPLDLLERPSFLRDNERAVAELAAESGEVAIVTGAIAPVPGGRPKPIANAALALHRGAVAFRQDKTLLPTYDVFDEARYFHPAETRALWTYRGRRIGLVICEDVWSGEFWGDRRPYDVDPVAELCRQGAELLLCVSSSPWQQRKGAFREAMICDATRRHGVPMVFCNLIGGNDELIFDGGSFTADGRGRVVQRCARFREDVALVEPFAPDRPELPGESADQVDALERALVLGIRDYFDKLGLGRAVIGLSGGIDSAVTAHLAALALGRENVLGLAMPGPFSSEHSLSDAQALARNLGVELRRVSIDPIYRAFLGQLAALFGARDSYGVTQENLQARIRGTLLMAVSNFENRLVLATGNKSELSVGYTTLYGDLVGGLAVIGDVTKRDVYRLARHANRDGPRIPVSSIEKPPSAELAPNQRDTDTLPPYDVLDSILTQAIEESRLPAEIEVPAGGSADTVRWVLRQIDRNEYKRRQAPVVLRVSPKAFGFGRRLPIAHKSGWGG